jgi:2-dehydro-3-deoxygluconokinase
MSTPHLPPSAPTPEVVTFGEVMAMFVAGESGPLQDVNTYTRALAGAEANVAVGLARLGHTAGWIGRVGDDPFGRYALAEFARSGVDTRTVTVDLTAPTGFQIKSRVAGGADPQVVYFRKDSAGSRLAPSPVADDYIAAARHLHVTGIPLALSESTRAFAFRAVAVARAAGVTVSFDPNLRPGLWASQQEMVEVTNALAAQVDWVLPGLDEAALLTGLTLPEEIAGHYLDLGASLVVIKARGEGASGHTRAGNWLQPIFPVAVVDTVGAGDGFATGLISGHLDGLDLPASLRRAAAVGACAVRSFGDKDGLPNRRQLAALLAPQGHKLELVG